MVIRLAGVVLGARKVGGRGVTMNVCGRRLFFDLRQDSHSCLCSKRPCALGVNLSTFLIQPFAAVSVGTD